MKMLPGSAAWFSNDLCVEAKLGEIEVSEAQRLVRLARKKSRYGYWRLQVYLGAGLCL